jgi:hypothetical protein
MGRADVVVMPAVQAVLDQLAYQLSTTNAGPVQHVRITPGSEVVASMTQENNEVCEGLCTIRLARIYPSSTLPQEDARSYNEGGPVAWAVDLELWCMRCGAQPGPDMDPTDADINDDAQTLLDDVAAMRRVGPALVDQDVIYNCVQGAWEPLSNDGGVLGGMMTLTIQVGCADC